MLKHFSRLTVLMLFLNGCFSTNDEVDHIATDEEVVKMCHQWIEKIETESSDQQLSGLNDMARYVDEYVFDSTSPINEPPPPPPDIIPMTIEPENGIELYRMLGVIAFGNGNSTAGLWTTMQALLHDPSNTRLLLQASAILIDLEACADAEVLLRKAKSLDKEDELIRLTLAAALSCRSKFRKAYEENSGALESAPLSRIAQKEVMRTLLEEIPGLKDIRNALYNDCRADISEALSLSSQQQLGDFTMAKSNESQALAMELFESVGTMPYDLPEGLLESLDGLNETYTATHSNLFTKPLQDKVTIVQSHINDSQAEFTQTLSDCCVDTNYDCSCFYDHCASSWNLIETGSDPMTFEAINHFLPRAMALFMGYEVKTVATLYENQSKLTQSSMTWATKHEYLLMAMKCKDIAMETAQALGPTIGSRPTSSAGCQMGDVCRTTEQEAAELEHQRRVEEARRAAAEEAARRAAAAENAKDNGFQGEFCLDSVGCIGVDGSKITVKIGGPFFAKVSVDTDKVSLSIRAGVGLSDPTGNAVSADISFGGTIGADGPSLEIVHSQSLHFGTIQQEYTLFTTSSLLRN